MKISLTYLAHTVQRRTITYSEMYREYVSAFSAKSFLFNLDKARSIIIFLNLVEFFFVQKNDRRIYRKRTNYMCKEKYVCSIPSKLSTYISETSLEATLQTLPEHGRLRVDFRTMLRSSPPAIHSTEE